MSEGRGHASPVVDLPVVLVGGFYDGHELTIPAARPMWMMPVPPPRGLWTSFDLPRSKPTLGRLEVFLYRQAFDDYGWPSRRDDGRLVYRLDH